MKPCKTDKRGRVHSFESFGTQEGPGIRYVVFMQGCLARCAYCQNPDTWDLKAGTLTTAKEVFDRIEKCLPYIESSAGGVTVSGGEPLLQPDFLIDLFKRCKKMGIHTAVDTGGFPGAGTGTGKKMAALIKLTDLFLVDLKTTSASLHKKLTSRDLKEVLSFINTLETHKALYWIRYVLVPGLNNARSDIQGLKTYISTLKYCQKVEFLAYHTLGRHKWEHLGLKYPLKDTRPATAKDIEKGEKWLNQ